MRIPRPMDPRLVPEVTRKHSPVPEGSMIERFAQDPRPLGLEEALKYITDAMGQNADFTAARIMSERSGDAAPIAAIAYLDPLVDKEALAERVVVPLSKTPPEILRSSPDLRKHVYVPNLMPAESITMAIEAVVDGDVVIVLDGTAFYYIASLRQYQIRPMAPPMSEPSVRGPRDAFNEDIRTNVALIRQRVRNRHLRMEEFRVGDTTRTRVVMFYMEDRVPKESLDKIRQSLSSIKGIDVLDSSFLVRYLTGRRWMMFPLVATTERADRACAELLQGRIGVMSDNSPFVLLFPIQLLTLFQASDDYYHLSVHSILLRVVRFIGWIAAALAPAIYVSITSFGPGVLSSEAALTLANARQGVPYPPLTEVLVMDIALEMLTEASTRLPTHVGGAATVVGGLILGTAAAQAGLVSNPMLIVVALTAIGSFLIPDYGNGLSWRTAKYLFTFSAAFLGIYGLATAALIVILYLCSIDVLNIPYLLPFAPWKWEDLIRDTVVETPDRRMRRPQD